MKNNTFGQALNSLLHPISLAAIGVLLWNDHWLRLHYPSWLSGKLGDFAWLVFAPFICAAVLAWFVPQRVKNHQQVVGLCAFLIIGAWFGLAKTIPAVHTLTVGAWEAVINGPVSQRLDPTDLVALPALWVGWQVWQRAKAPTLKRSHLASMVFALAVVATLASDDGPYYTYTDRGVTTICSEGSSLVIYLDRGSSNFLSNNQYNSKSIDSTIVYSSADGGLSWQPEKTLQTEGEEKQFDQQPNCSKPDDHLQISDANIQYRWQPAQTIEISTDGGQHWKTEFDLYQLRQEVRNEYIPPSDKWYEHVYVDASPGPRGGLIDSATHNIVLAMGWDGVLVGTSVGIWTWVAVGKYQLKDLADFNRVKDILFFEWWEAGALIMLVVTTSAAYIHRHAIGRWVIVAIGWIGWAAITALLPHAHPAVDLRYDFPLDLNVLLTAFVLLLVAIPVTIAATWDFLRNYRKLLLSVMGMGLAAAVLYLFPFILWTQGTIPRYTTAMIFALFLTAAAVIAGYKYLRPILPVVEPKQKLNITADLENTEPESGL